MSILFRMRKRKSLLCKLALLHRRQHRLRKQLKQWALECSLFSVGTKGSQALSNKLLNTVLDSEGRDTQWELILRVSASEGKARAPASWIFLGTSDCLRVKSPRSLPSRLCRHAGFRDEHRVKCNLILPIQETGVPSSSCWVLCVLRQLLRSKEWKPNRSLLPPPALLPKVGLGGTWMGRAGSCRSP